MVLDRSMVQPGMEVVGSDFESLGRVTRVPGRYFIVEHKRLLRSPETYYIPRDAIEEVVEVDHRVVLNIASDRIDEMGWTKPPDET